jgi:hypothetical protein
MLVATFPKNASHEVRAQLGTYAGRPVVSLWVFAATREGEPVATRYDLSLGVESLPALEEAVHALREAAKNPAAFDAEPAVSR